MNERIREILTLCTFPDNNIINGSKFTGSIDYEKFAELIVKECMTICEDVTERNDPTIACYYAIKEHFGI